MAMSFFRHSPAGLEHIEARAILMLADARHSFDLATTAVLSGNAPVAVAKEIRDTDHRINQAEQDRRAELVVHATVHGTADIASVLGFMLLLKKIERIGDQAKNILDLAEAGVTLTAAPGETTDAAELFFEQLEISSLYGTAGELLRNPEEPRAQEFVNRVTALIGEYQARIDSYMHSAEPGYQVVPLAIYYRYLKRIVANLRGIVGVALDPLPHIDYLDHGATDTDD